MKKAKEKLVIISELHTDCIRIAIKWSLTIRKAVKKVFKMKARHKIIILIQRKPSFSFV